MPTGGLLGPAVGGGGIIRLAAATDLAQVAALRPAFLVGVRGLPPGNLAGDFAHRTTAFLEAARSAGRLRSWLAKDASGCVNEINRHFGTGATAPVMRP